MKPRTMRIVVVIAVLAVFTVAMVTAGCANTTPTTTTTTTQPSTPPSTQPSSTTATTTTTPPTTAAPVTGAALGKMIWDAGADSNGPVKWTHGVPSKMKSGACKQCHGPLGKGGPNGAPNITYPKIKAAFPQAKFERAVTKGLDEAGKALDKKMPRYGTLSPDDLAGLWDFVRTLK